MPSFSLVPTPGRQEPSVHLPLICSPKPMEPRLRQVSRSVPCNSVRPRRLSPPVPALENAPALCCLAIPALLTLSPNPTVRNQMLVLLLLPQPVLWNHGLGKCLALFQYWSFSSQTGLNPARDCSGSQIRNQVLVIRLLPQPVLWNQDLVKCLALFQHWSFASQTGLIPARDCSGNQIRNQVFVLHLPSSPNA